MKRVPKLDIGSMRVIIAATKCPTCDAPRGSKCINQMIALGVSRQPKRNPGALNWNCRYYYAHFIHAARFRAFRRLKKSSETGAQNAE